jgi:putative ubiquitin-RnfH superfamily antitoxin RatB of RatAB toxin-antitoxin module
MINSDAECDASGIRVDVVYALVDRYWRLPVVLPVAATVADALAAVELERWIPGQGLDVQALEGRLAVFGRLVTMATALRDGDRIEILRPLLVDPKQSRRQRAGTANSKKR